MVNLYKRPFVWTISVLLFLSAAAAQPLADLLPAETFFAVGAQDLAGHEAKLAPFIAEIERLELTEALAGLFPAEEGDVSLDTVPPEFEGLGLLDLVGQDAWIAASASSFNPLPAVTLLARLSPAASAAAEQVLSDAATRSGVESLSEGDYSFYREALEGEDALVQVIAYAQADDVLMLSTNPDALRGVLRQLGGSSDPRFTTSEAYGNSLGQLGDANFHAYLDFAQVANIASPFAQGFGFDQLVNRLLEAFQTAGVSAGAVRITDAGIENEGLQVLNENGGDASLYALLGEPAAVDPATAGLAPADVLSWTSGVSNLSGWWDYLNELAVSTPELGGDLDFLLSSFLGIDLRGTLFSWAGDELTTVTTGVGDTVEPGMPSSNLLGDSVYIIGASDEAAAQAGLDSLLQSLSTTVASFTDPSGGPGDAATTVQDVAGVSVTTLDVTEGIGLSYAVTGGRAFIATSQEAMAAVLAAQDASLETAEVFRALTAAAPQGASSLSITNDRETLVSSAQQITSQLELTAGLGGASNLDFEAVEAASEKLQSFLGFVAERLGFSVGYGERRGDSVYGYSQTDVSW